VEEGAATEAEVEGAMVVARVTVEAEAQGLTVGIRVQEV
jgi:hypothetical protein